MDTIHYIHGVVIPAAFKLLPEKMDSSEAKAELLAIGLQETEFRFRTQQGGPAEGFWQFESGGGWKGVVNHKATAAIVRDVLATLSYGLPDLSDYYAVEHNDILACVFARLLLWTHPTSLPLVNQPSKGWVYYADTWRPGKPHRATWEQNFNKAWEVVNGG